MPSDLPYQAALHPTAQSTARTRNTGCRAVPSMLCKDYGACYADAQVTICDTQHKAACNNDVLWSACVQQ